MLIIFQWNKTKQKIQNQYSQQNQKSHVGKENLNLKKSFKQIKIEKNQIKTLSEKMKLPKFTDLKSN